MGEILLGQKGNKESLCEKSDRLFFKITIFSNVTLYFGRNLLALLRKVLSP
jgi:hypothetical protein